jgi:hypothetical protein
MSDPTALLSAIDTGGGKDGPKRASVLHHEGLDRKRVVRDRKIVSATRLARWLRFLPNIGDSHHPRTLVL